MRLVLEQSGTRWISSLEFPRELRRRLQGSATRYYNLNSLESHSGKKVVQSQERAEPARKGDARQS